MIEIGAEVKVVLTIGAITIAMLPPAVATLVKKSVSAVVQLSGG